MPDLSMKLTFCEIKTLDKNTIEVIPKSDIEIGPAEIDEFHEFFNHFNRSVGVLVNRENSYSYSFYAQNKIATNDKMAAVAILIPKLSELSKAEYIASAIKGSVDIKVFIDRSEALIWLSGYQV